MQESLGIGMMEQSKSTSTTPNNLPYHKFDYTTPWFEFLSYQECCFSLGVPVSLNRFLRYHTYLREVNVK